MPEVRESGEGSMQGDSGCGSMLLLEINIRLALSKLFGVANGKGKGLNINISNSSPRDARLEQDKSLRENVEKLLTAMQGRTVSLV